MNLALAFPVYNRPHYLSQVLKSWQGVRGADDVVAVYRHEPGVPEVEELVREEFPFGAGGIYVNDFRLGNDRNMLAAVSTAFETGADFVVAAEDDVLVSADLLEYMAAMADRYADDKSVLAVTAWQDQAPGPLDEVQRAGHFWGGACWGMWGDRFEGLRAGWPPSGFGYDRYLWENCHSTGRVTIQPLATRCRNIGETGVGGTWSFQSVWDTQRFTADIPPQCYRERP